MEKEKRLNQTQIQALLLKCKTQDQKTFTQTLKNLERECKSRYFIVGTEGMAIFNECAEIFEEESDNWVTQCNALRLAKYCVDHPDALGEQYKKPWDLYLKTIFHSDGRVRMAGVRLLERYYFSLSYSVNSVDLYQGKTRKTDEKLVESTGRFVLEKYLYMQDLEEQYIKKHEEELNDEDLPDIAGRMPWSSDTKNKFLKSIRMGIEAFYRGIALEKVMEKYGYQEKTSEEWPELSIFHRYEKIIEEKGGSSLATGNTYIIRAKLEHNKKTYRDIEIPANTSLYHVAEAILAFKQKTPSIDHF